MRQRISQTFDEYQEKAQKILLIPWKYTLPETSEALKSFFNEFIDVLKDEQFDAVYVLSLTRPNELGANCKEEFIRVLTSYGDSSSFLHKAKTPVGFVSVSINDINSFRKLQKIIIKHIILLGNLDICSVCGETLFENNKGVKECYSCGLNVIDTRCSHCKSPFVFTRYTLPKVFEKIMDEPGYNVVYDEIALDFLNITNCKNDQKDAPICPYCGQC